MGNLINNFLKDFFKQFYKYSIIGFGSVIIDYSSYKLFIFFEFLTPSYSKITSFIIGGVWSFYFNKKITFKSKNKNYLRIILFIFLSLMSLFFNSFTHDYFYFYYSNNISFLIATIISVVINFLGLKFIVFNEKI